MNTHAVEDFVSFFQATQYRDRILNRRFVDHNGLKTSFERRIFFDIFAVFVEGGCADAVQFASCKHRLEKVACVHTAFGFACADDGVKFIDKQQHSAVLLFDFTQNRFESFFKFATIFRACDKSAHIECEDMFVFESFGNVASYDTLSKSFGYCGFADACLTDKNGVVLGFSRQNSNDVSYFVVTTDDGIELSASGSFDHIVTVFVENVVGVLGAIVCHLRGFNLRKRAHKVLFREFTLCKCGFEGRGGIVENRGKYMLHADEIVALFFCVFLCLREHKRGVLAQIHFACAATRDRRHLRENPIDFSQKLRCVRIL